MPDIVTRIGAVLSATDAAAVIAALGENPTNAYGHWRIVTTNRWELWSGAPGADDRQVLATVDLAYNSPHPLAVTITRVALTIAGQQCGLDSTAVCDAALASAQVRFADCERVVSTAPPVFTGRRVTEKSQWQDPRADDHVSLPVSHGADLTERYLDAEEDKELRRLHYLASFGGLSSGPAQRYAELRMRDRRAVIREPLDDELIPLPRQRMPEDDSVTA